MSLLEISNLQITFETGERTTHAVRDASLSINKGEWVALVGESGSGKSVSALSIMRLLPASASITAQKMQFDGTDLLALSEQEMRDIRGKRIAMIFQEPMSALNPLHHIGRQLAEIIQIHQRVGRADVRNRIQELLKMVGLEKFSDRLNTFPHQLSGGERQRLMIAMAMANNPELLIADEPTTALDVTLQLQILELLRKLQREHNMAILLITHDLPLVKRVSDKVAIMKDGVIVETGATDKVFENPQHDYTKTLINAAPSGGPLPLPRNAEQLLQLDDLKVHFPIRTGVFRRTTGYVKAVDGISLRLAEGETVGIVGESGSGKTTLGLAVLRLIKSDGPILFLGNNLRDIHGRALRAMRKNMQIVFQDPYASLNPRMTIGDIVGEGLEVHRPELTRAQRNGEVIGILSQVGLEEFMLHRYPHEFSGGQRQRIAVARAMILRPRLVVLDEPTSALDLTLQAQLIDLLKQFQKEEKLGYVFISHDLRTVRAISHQIVVIRGGKVVEEGPAERIFTQPREDYTKALIKAAFVE